MRERRRESRGTISWIMGLREACVEGGSESICMASGSWACSLGSIFSTGLDFGAAGARLMREALGVSSPVTRKSKTLTWGGAGVSAISIGGVGGTTGMVGCAEGCAGGRTGGGIVASEIGSGVASGLYSRRLVLFSGS